MFYSSKSLIYTSKLINYFFMLRENKFTPLKGIVLTFKSRLRIGMNRFSEALVYKNLILKLKPTIAML